MFPEASLFLSGSSLRFLSVISSGKHLGCGWEPVVSETLMDSRYSFPPPPGLLAPGLPLQYTSEGPLLLCALLPLRPPLSPPHTLSLVFLSSDSPSLIQPTASPDPLCLSPLVLGPDSLPQASPPASPSPLPQPHLTPQTHHRLCYSTHTSFLVSSSPTHTLPAPATRPPPRPPTYTSRPSTTHPLTPPDTHACDAIHLPHYQQRTQRNHLSHLHQCSRHKYRR